MKMLILFDSCVVLLFGLFSFSAGKPCPERTRPHRTRCDIYYKCTELAADKHVWLPTNCEEGLVYEHSLTVCVLPADDWECLMDDLKVNSSLNGNSEKQPQAEPTANRNTDFYVVSSAEDQDSKLNTDDAKIEIIIGPDISNEDSDEATEEELYDGSGNGGELIELDGFLTAQNREAETANVPVLKKEEKVEADDKIQKETFNTGEKEELEEMLQNIKTKAKMDHPSANIDPKLTAHLQRLSQLIDGLKETYQTVGHKPQEEQSLRPDQLNAFLAHFNIRNKFDSLDPNESNTISKASISKPNRTLHYKPESNIKLSPETKVVLSNTLFHRYGSSSTKSGGDHSSSQIVVNRPGGTVLFSLPAHHYMEHAEYSPKNAPKISEDTLKTVLELSKQMITQQNVPQVIPNPTYFAPSIMQPILLTPQLDTPFSTNYIGHYGNQYGNGGAFNQNYKYKKPAKRPQININDKGNYESGSSNVYSNEKPGATVIHNNVIPIHLSASSSGDKGILDSYGHPVSLYPPVYEDIYDSHTNYHDNSNPNSDYSLDLKNNGYSVSSTIRPSYGDTSATANPYGSTPKPFEFKTTASTINQYFTPSEHLDDHNVNDVFSSVDNYGSIPRPLKTKKTTVQNYKLSQENTHNGESYDFHNQLFPQVNSHKVHVRPNSQNSEIFESDNDNYQDNANDDEPQLITYSYGSKKKPGQEGQFSNYDDSDSQSPLNTIFSSNKPYMPRPQSSSHSSMSSTNSYYSSDKNKYRPISSPISSSYGEGTHLVNVGGNFISFDVFQNSILPLMGNNAADLFSSLNSVEVITCAVGVRQPNITDCTRYYVCSKKDGKVLSYSCPPYTAFNSNTRICDAKTYALCNEDPIVTSYSVSENKRIRMEVLKALQEQKRRQMLQQQQQQAINAQNTANLMQQYNSPSSTLFNRPSTSSSQDSAEQNMLDAYMQQANTMPQSLTTTLRPLTTTPVIKKRKYYCKEGDKIADQTSMYNYFVCYKNAKGQMKGHRMTCSKSLLFCAKTSMCTLPSKCS